MDTKKHIVDLEALREMLHISPRVPGQSFVELPFEEEIMEFLRFLGHSAQIKTLTDSQVISSANFMGAISQKKRRLCLSHLGRSCVSSGTQESKEKQRDDDILFSTIKVVSRHQNTQQYSAILPIELTTKDIRNTKAYKEYYACATREAAPKPKASARKKKGGSALSTTPPTPIATPTPTTIVVAALRLSPTAKGKQPARATSPTDPSDVERIEAEQLKIVLKRSRQETHISQHSGFSTDEGTEIAKIDKPKYIESGGDDEETKSDWESEDEETTEKEEESFDPIPRTPEESEDDGNSEEDQGLRITEEERMHEEEADELYRDVDINQGRGLQVSQDIEDSHVTLTPTHSDGQQESSSTSSFVTNLLNPIIELGMESIFTTGSSSVTPIPSPKSTMTPSIITTTTTASQPPIPSTPIPSDVLQTLPTFASVVRFEDRVKSLEVNFSEFMRTNQSTEVVSNIPGLVHQYMHQEMTKAVREAVQIQTDRLQDSLQRENDEFIRTIDDNMKKIIKEQVKSQVKARVTRILPRIEESVNAQLEAKVLTRSSHSSRTSYVVAADLLEMELKKILIDKMEGNKESAILKRRHEDDDDQEGPSAGSDQGSKRQREGGEHVSAKEPVQTTCQMEESSHPVFETGAEDQPIVQTSQYPEWFSQPRKPPTLNCDWNKSLPAAQGNAHVDMLTLELLAGLTYELMRGSCNSLTELEYHLEEEPLNYDKHAFWGVSHWGRKRQQFYGFAVNREFALDVYSKRRIIVVTDLKIPDTYRSDLKRREAYTAYSNPRGFIYQNKDKKNRLMRIDELQKFSDGTLNDVRNALDNRLKGIRMQYLPTTIWRKGDKDRAAAMIQAIDKMLKTRRIMRSLERQKIHVDNESAICVVRNPIYHSKTKHIEIRHHFIRDSYEKRLIEMVKIHTDSNVADLLTKAFDVTSSKTVNFVKPIHAIVDGKAVVISESSVRSDLFFDDEDGGYIPGSNKGSITLAELMEIYRTLSNRVAQLKNELSTTKAIYNKAFITLTNRVKQLESHLKQTRKMDKDEDVSLASKQGEVQETAEPSRDDDDDTTLAKTLLNIKRSATKDKGKEIMQETELPRKLKKKEMIQLSLDVELAQKLYAKELEKEGERQEHERYNFKNDLELQRQLDQRKDDDQVHTFVPKDSEIEREVIKRAGFDLQQGISKKQRLDQQTKETEEEARAQVIIEYKIVKEGKISTYHITRANGSTKRYTSMINLLENIDREDLETLWKLVKDKCRNTRPEEGYERVLWGDLKVMFKPDIESEV
nr:putative ribonuclease H-like domain-containing protein [Tanacetum cinerariifolium]